MTTYPRPARLVSLAAAVAAFVVLTGCVASKGGVGPVAVNEQIPVVPVYAHSADYSELSGVLFKPFADEPYWGIAFSHEVDAAYGGYFVLGSVEDLLLNQPGDRVTVTGRVSDERFAAWQSGTYYELFTVRPTDTRATDLEYPNARLTSY